MYLNYSLKNGIKVIAEDISYVHSIAIGVWVKAGSVCENAKNNGISHFIEHMMFKGTKTRSAREIAEELDDIGGQLNAFTSTEYTCYYAKTVDEHFYTAVDILSDILKNSVFDTNEINKERKVIFEEIKMYEDSPEEYIHDRYSELMFFGHPLGNAVLGQVKSLNRIDQAAIADYMKQYYTTENVIIAVAGNISKIPDMEDFLNKHFEGVNRPSERKCTYPEYEYMPQFEIISKNNEQVNLCLGTEAISQTDDRRYELSILNTVFGGSMSSRLFQEIREKRGMAYSIYSYQNAHRQTGLFSVYAGCSRENFINVLKLVLMEMYKIADSGLTKEELIRGKEQLKSSLVLSLENTGNRMTRLGRLEIYFKKVITIDEIIDKIMQVNAEDILNFAQRMFSRPLTLVAIGPIETGSKEYKEAYKLLREE